MHPVIWIHLSSPILGLPHVSCLPHVRLYSAYNSGDVGLRFSPISTAIIRAAKGTYKSCDGTGRCSNASIWDDTCLSYLLLCHTCIPVLFLTVPRHQKNPFCFLRCSSSCESIQLRGSGLLLVQLHLKSRQSVIPAKQFGSIGFHK